MANKNVTCVGSVSGCVCDAFSELESLGSEAREIVDNASENLAQTQRIQTFDETASTLENFSEPDVPGSVGDLPVSYTETQNKRGVSRANRCGNAVAMLEGAKSACENWIGEQREIIDKLQERDDMETEELEGLDDVEGANDRTVDDIESEISEVEQLISDIEDAVSEAEGCEFPGMYG